jgi:nucleotidyltransferase substrate binding protein (TIGR01987 family)
MTQEIRWPQRFRPYQVALFQLAKTIDMSPLSEIEQLGLIKAFEITCDLAWNLMRDYFVFHGVTNITDARESVRAAYEKNIISDGDTWMEMVKSQNMTAHSYNPEVIDLLSEKIITSFYPLFQDFHDKMRDLIDLEEP